MKSQKGSVSVNILRGRLRLRLPRQLYEGEQKYLSLGIPDNPGNRKFAELKAKEIEFDILSGNFDPSLNKYRCLSYQPGTDELSQQEPLLIELWDKFTQFKSSTIRPSTMAVDYQKTKNLIKKLPFQFAKDSLKIRDFLLLNHTPGEARRYLIRLSACCDWAVRSNLISENPFKGMAQDIKIRQPKKLIESFTAGERDQIIQTFQEDPVHCHYANFVKFLFFTGCRPSEAIALEWGNISPDFRLITFQQAATGSLDGINVEPGLKTQEQRQFPVNAQVKDLLREIKNGNLNCDNFCFSSPHGKLIDFHNFRNRSWMETLDKLPNISYKKPYATRATFITLCLEAGVDPKDIAIWVGNSAGVIYKHYAAANINLSVPDL